MNILVIPARGGSKRIPKKNVRSFHGKPMIAWSILAAQRSQIFDSILVSTDDNEIRAIAREWGADAPFLRPANLADDYATTGKVMAHAVEWVRSNGLRPRAVCCLYATAPFVSSDDIVRGEVELLSGGWNYAFSATDYAAPVFRAFKPTQHGGTEMLFPDKFEMRSQDLPEVWHDAAQFYWGLPEVWLQEKKIFDSLAKPIHIPRWRVQDIDTLEDWKRAEMLADSIFAAELES